jgi:phosphoglycolate phosphatase-like HAD superfamily hydrolase
MEILKPLAPGRPRVKVALFDFDGTLSTLRHGWERTMEPFMVESIAGPTPAEPGLVDEVRAYIDRSTGIQTYFQMEWLVEAVRRHGRNPGGSTDPWAYKAEYNRRLMRDVRERRARIADGTAVRTDFLMRGSEAFLQALRERGVEICVASGTDDPDVKEEAEALGLARYFKEIAGAPVGRAECSKEAVLRRLVDENGLHGQEVVVFGDGKVEIALGCEVGAITVGVASDEERLHGVNPVKRERLVQAGAHAILDCFEPMDPILDWLRIR